MTYWRKLALASIVALTAGCGGDQASHTINGKTEKDPDYGLSVSDQLKRDLDAENAKVNAANASTGAKK